jgi:signal transduction histidine kinase
MKDVGGGLTLTSLPGKGTRLVFEMPLANKENAR